MHVADHAAPYVPTKLFRFRFTAVRALWVCAFARTEQGVDRRGLHGIRRSYSCAVRGLVRALAWVVGLLVGTNIRLIRELTPDIFPIRPVPFHKLCRREAGEGTRE